MDAHEEEKWVLFRSFADETAARGMCVWLRNEQIDARREKGEVFIAHSLRFLSLIHI